MEPLPWLHGSILGRCLLKYIIGTQFVTEVDRFDFCSAAIFFLGGLKLKTEEAKADAATYKTVAFGLFSVLVKPPSFLSDV